MLDGGEDRGHAEKRYLHADGHPGAGPRCRRGSCAGRTASRCTSSPRSSDISAQKAAADALAHQALHDPLTGLPNRTLFNDRLDARARPLAPHRRPAGGRVHRRRPLQGRQRQPRPREPATELLQTDGARGCAQAIRAVGLPWRASAATSSRSCCEDVADERRRDRASPTAMRRELRAAVLARGHDDFYADASASASRSCRAATDARRRASCATPTPRCTAPRRAARRPRRAVRRAHARRARSSACSTEARPAPRRC